MRGEPLAGLACAMLPGLAGILTGAGTGLITPLGFAALAASTPTERLGQTMGAAAAANSATRAARCSSPPSPRSPPSPTAAGPSRP
ncbi:hypothetical protein [Streptomyces sp. NPDC086777]|uniref:hypothetical protein n=1 Tax=Streptomyces sp. NPDC086777 TaxID=3154866 RepID=UPI00344D890D